MSLRKVHRFSSEKMRDLFSDGSLSVSAFVFLRSISIECGSVILMVVVFGQIAGYGIVITVDLGRLCEVVLGTTSIGISSCL